jgi:hypothetical protein
MKVLTLLIVACFALGTVSLGVASAKTVKQEKSFFMLPIIGKYLNSHPEDWPQSPYKFETAEQVLDLEPLSPYKYQTVEQVLDLDPQSPYKYPNHEQVLDGWPITPYRPVTPNQQMK